MTTRLIHTPDWQIRKVFCFVDDATMDLLQEARLRAVPRLGEPARDRGITYAVLTLLIAVLRDAEHEAKERYLSPVLNRGRPYLQLLLPGGDIAIDEDLRITGVVGEAGYEEAFRHHGMGTQERIAILVRLAFAEMLVEQGHPATVVLDDALVSSGDRRMSRMFDVLAARNVQVVILTCREQLSKDLAVGN